MTFSEALELAKEGKKIFREGWNNKNGMHCYVQFPDKYSKMTQAYLVIVIPNCEEGTRQIPHLPSRADLFTDDWGII